jgi:hypothetical protein
MVYLNIQEIPDRYLLKRWSATATIDAPVPDAYNRTTNFGIPGTNTWRYNRLCQKINQLASNACFSAETYELVSAAVDRLNADVDAKRRGVQGEEPAQEGRASEVPLQMPHQQATGVQNEEKYTNDGFKNPQRQPNKGHLKESEKRKKTLLEQREDAAKKNKKVKKDGETTHVQRRRNPQSR